MKRLSPTAIIVLIATVILLADQWSKYLAHDYFVPTTDIGASDSAPREREPKMVISGFLEFRHAHNTGAVGGLLSGNNGLLMALSGLAIVLLIVFRRSFVTSHAEHLVALGLITGGIAGNFVDRLVRGYVEDFLVLYVGKMQITYVFNIADAAICSGVVVYIIALLLPRKQPESAPAPGATPRREVQQAP